MVEDTLSRNKPLETASRKPAVPGSNSWAQSQGPTQSSQREHDSPRPTNRERYENKPMPELPSESSGQTVAQIAKPYIQPAIPLIGTVPPISRRAVTDPPGPKTSFVGRKPSVNQLRKVFAHSREGSKADKQPSPPMPYLTGKAADILGLTVDQGSKRSAKPKSNLVPVHHETALEDAVEDSPKYVATARSTQSSPIPAIQHPTYSRPNSQSISASSGSGWGDSNNKEQFQPDLVFEGPVTPRQDDHAVVAGHLAPPKIASYGKVGGTGIVQEHGMIRVESVQGIIENAASAASGHTTPISPIPVQHRNEYLQPVSFSPDNYRGVWENDPAVGYSLPPFSPFPLQNHSAHRQPPRSAATTPPVFRDDYTNASFPSSGLPSGYDTGHPNRQLPRPQDYRPAMGSANSWAQGNSAASDIGPLSGLLPQRWPLHHNPVPSPPHSRRDYERPGSLAAGLSQLDMTIHHHLDTAFGSLSRLVAEKHDKVLDQVLRRLDDIEDGVAKSSKHVKSDMKNLNSEVTRMKGAITSFSNGNEGIKEILHALQEKVNALEKHAEETQRLCQQIISSQNAVDSGSERRSRISTHRRTESAHGALGLNTDHQQQQNGFSRAASRVRTSKTTNRSHRSNTASSQPTNGRLEDTSGRVQTGTGMNDARGSAPDIRNHPAYAGIAQPATHMYDQNGVPVGIAFTAGVPYGSQELGDGGWYHQAYGSN